MRCAAAWMIASLPASAGAWGSEGHQYIGNLASSLLNPNARRHVRALLGPTVTLAEAAVWPDCIRSVSPGPSNTFVFRSDKFTPKVCRMFGSRSAEVQRMTDYAARNWTNCDYSGQPTKCNFSYHFADVNVHEHDDYNASYFGARPYDVVHAIEAAEAVLQCASVASCAAPAPFSIADKREALFLLAHFVGDVHQPLHVGAVYLDSSNAETDDNGAETAGGNLLLLSSSQNLHHTWDQIPASLGTKPSKEAIASACETLASTDLATETPENWARESIAAAKIAYGGMTFARDPNVANQWNIEFGDANAYAAMRTASQKQRLIAAGTRLAGILNSLWPSKRVAAACRIAAH